MQSITTSVLAKLYDFIAESRGPYFSKDHEKQSDQGQSAISQQYINMCMCISQNILNIL